MVAWLNFERDRLRVAWRGAALDHLGADIDPGEGIDLSARLLDADPLDEAALRAHMLWLAHSGQSARARQAYREFIARLAEDLGLPPGRRTESAARFPRHDLQTSCTDGVDGAVRAR